MDHLGRRSRDLENLANVSAARSLDFDSTMLRDKSLDVLAALADDDPDTTRAHLDAGGVGKSWADSDGGHLVSCKLVSVSCKYEIVGLMSFAIIENCTSIFFVFIP